MTHLTVPNVRVVIVYGFAQTFQMDIMSYAEFVHRLHFEVCVFVVSLRRIYRLKVPNLATS